MTQHPLTTAFEHLDEQPAPGFRETLLAEMLVELTQPPSAQPVDASDTEPQEITVLKKIDRSNPTPMRTRVIVGVAAAVIVAVGVTAFVVNRRNADTTVVPVTTPEPSPEDSATANAALLTVDQLGTEWSPHPESNETRAQWLAAAATQPACADYNRAVQSAESGAASSSAAFINVQNQELIESVTVFPTKEAASKLMDALSAPGYPSCFFASWDADYKLNFSEGETSITKSFNFAAPAAHGDRQVAFGHETKYGPATTRLWQQVFVQVDRSIIWISAAPDGLGSTDPAGIIERSLTAAIDSVNKATASG